jgi:dolichol-phosphate mannosyltransferase
MNEQGSISVIIPTLDESDNIDRLIAEFLKLEVEFELTKINEIIFVDDGSKDGTIEIIEKLKTSPLPFKIRLIERGTKKGTVSAAIEGARLASNETIIIMDADLQHPPHVIAEMIKRDTIVNDAVVASRHVQGGGNLWSPLRGVISRTAILISHILIPSSRKLKDPTSGYFVTRKKYIADMPLQNGRSKILLYMIASYPDMKVIEVPYIFVSRKNGNSKIVTRKPSFIIDFLVEAISYMKINKKSLVRSKARDTAPQIAANR